MAECRSNNRSISLHSNVLDKIFPSSLHKAVSCTVCYRDTIHHVFLVAPPFGLLELVLVFCGMVFLGFINDSADVFE